METARLWNSLGFWRETKSGRSFHIHGVTGPDEYTAVVNDNTFTNVMARFNLNYAVELMGYLAAGVPRGTRADRRGAGHRTPEVRDWSDAALAMFIPFSENGGDPPAGRRVPEPRGLGRAGHRPRSTGRCCCTSTRW